MTAVHDPIPFVDLGAVHALVLPELRLAFERVVAHSGFSGGEEVACFEHDLAALVGARHAVGVGSGTAALHLILVAAGVGPGDEVILPANTFFATAGAVAAAGAAPVAVDVDERTALADPSAVAAAVTSRTAALIAVHLYGQPADMDALRAIADRHALLLIEDAAQAITGAWRDQPVGSLGDAAAFSFYPSKNLGALGEAGAVTTGDATLAARIAALRHHGQARKHEHLTPGFNERLDGLQAAFLRVKLGALDRMQAMRLDAVATYQARLPAVTEVTLLDTDPRARHAHHLMVVGVGRRAAVIDALARRGVMSEVHYPVPVHRQPAWTAMGGQAGPCPVAEHLAHRVLSLPLYAGLTTGQVQRCVDALTEAIAETLQAA